MQKKETYYFVSAGYAGNSPAWIRKPFMTKKQALEWINTRNPNIYSSIEIYSEDLLKTIIYDKSENGEFIETNLRELLFGTLYSASKESYEIEKNHIINTQWYK